MGLYTRSLHRDVDSSPAVVDGLVYVGSDDDNIYCLNAASGALVWNYTTGGYVDSSPAVVDGLVYVGCDDGNIRCLDAATGVLIWRYMIAYGGVMSSPAVVGGLVYVGCENGNVYCLNAATGALVWRYNTGNFVDSSPAVVNGVVYIGSEDVIYAFGPLPLTVSISPSSVFADVGQPQLFNSNVTGGTSPYTYQWYLDGAPVIGATNPTWAFTPTFVSSCTVSLVVNDSANPPASVQSDNASVTAVIATVYIMGDGSVVPSYAPISSINNVTYTLSGNVSYPTYEGIIVERSNIVIDGNEHTVQGNQDGDTGLSLTSVSNVTIKNTDIKDFQNGIYVYSSSGTSISGNNITNNEWDGINLYSSNFNSISGNNITENDFGSYLGSSSNFNSISGNNITNNGNGIWLYSSSGNSISGNNITANDYYGGIYLLSCSGNSVSGNNITANNNAGISLGSSNYASISGNNITNNEYGIYLCSCSGNNIFHNNFVNNNVQVYSASDSANIWDNGYPSGGNYWSDCTGTDLFSGPYQNISGIDGIGDTPYIIDANNTDNYPLTNPYSTNSLSITISPASSTLDVGRSQTFNSTVSGGTLPYTYQWCLNGTAVPGADSSSWTFTPTSEGTYTIYANVTDSIGAQATSDTATVNVYAAPSTICGGMQGHALFN